MIIKTMEIGYIAFKMGMEMLKLCDELWAFGEPTEGMEMEIAQAERLGVPVCRLDIAGGKRHE